MNLESETARHREALWGLLRLTLGIGQMAGASAALFALVTTGVSPLAIGLAVFTSLFTGMSVLFFGSKMPDKSQFMLERKRNA